ncbi:mycothiol synthase [uncultured Tessaracoccus sp.]|uniref:mycothiol synthase n=1 Tax=uncultured Tessaracoccus sp. TaxID=905023 RepID=UPI0025DBDD4C|nr:mycothiol synthase [uncultured Tessaracoccus sp.]
MTSVFDAAHAVDGVSPLNESGTLVVRGLREGRVIEDGPAAAVVDLRDESLMLAVHPQHRRQGHGLRLLTRVLDEHPGLGVWAFGSLPGSAELARAAGLTSVRTLLRMERSLADVADPPSDPRIRPYRPADAGPIVDVNARAFAHHPEQGRLTLEEFDTFTREPWFEPEGLLVAHDEGAVTGFHWTKRHGAGVGEVYVLAVDPAHEGHGLGRVLLAHGLAHLRRVGDTVVELYVEASEERVVRLYEAAGFHVAARDTYHRRMS